MTARDFEMTPRLDELLRLIFQPVSAYTTDFNHYVEVHVPLESAPAFNYGYAMPTIGLALAVLALGQIAWHALQNWSNPSRTAATRSLLRARMRRNGAALLLLAIAAFFFAFPITRLARYLGLVFACMGALASTALEGRAARRVGDALLLVALAAQIGLVAVQSPRVLYSPAELWRLARMPAADRELSRDHGAFASRDAARFRDQALSAATTVLFGDDVLEPGPLWNSTMSNRVAYLPGASDPTEAADALGAAFVACTRGTPRCTVLEQRSGAWTLVGELYPGIISRECLDFRRIAAGAP